MRFLFSFLTELFIEERSNEGLISALRRLGGATAAFRHMAMHRHLFDLPIYRRYVVGAHDDPLFHLSHRHYLSKRFGCRKRVECVVSHYRYEGEFYNRRYQDAVYRDGGLTVWSKAIDDLVYSIRLQPTTDARQEGGTGVVAYAGDTALSELSFVWIDGSVLGLERGILPFVTKNQSVRHNNAALQRFRKDFPQNSPAYFCLAALYGIAEAHGKDRIAAIRHDCQISFSTDHAASFRNAYSEFWKAFGGVDVDNHFYLMPVPMAMRPLASIKSKHRKRAVDRRSHWLAISQATAGAVNRHRAAPLALAPITIRILALSVAQLLGVEAFELA